MKRFAILLAVGCVIALASNEAFADKYRYGGSNWGVSIGNGYGGGVTFGESFGRGFFGLSTGYRGYGGYGGYRGYGGYGGYPAFGYGYGGGYRGGYGGYRGGYRGGYGGYGYRRGGCGY